MFDDQFELHGQPVRKDEEPEAWQKTLDEMSGISAPADPNSERK